MHLQKQHIGLKYRNRVGYIGRVGVPLSANNTPTSKPSCNIVGTYRGGRLELMRVGPLEKLNISISHNLTCTNSGKGITNRQRDRLKKI